MFQGEMVMFLTGMFKMLVDTAPSDAPERAALNDPVALAAATAQLCFLEADANRVS